MNFTLHLILCGVLLAITLGVVLYRKWLEDHNDHYIHLHNDSHDTGVINSQQAMIKRLETLGRFADVSHCRNNRLRDYHCGNGRLCSLDDSRQSDLNGRLRLRVAGAQL